LFFAGDNRFFPTRKPFFQNYIDFLSAFGLFVQTITGLRNFTETQMLPIALSIKETAKALGLGRSSIYALLKGGRLTAIKVGRRTLVTTNSIARLIGTVSNPPRPEDVSSL